MFHPPVYQAGFHCISSISNPVNREVQGYFTAKDANYAKGCMYYYCSAVGWALPTIAITVGNAHPTCSAIMHRFEL